MGSCSVRWPGCPSEIDTDDIESRLFDLTVLSMQLALAEGDMRVFEGHRQRMVEIAMLLEQKNTIPAVRAQLGYLVSIQESGFLGRDPMCRRGPLTFADDGQSGAVNDEVPAGARAGAPEVRGRDADRVARAWWDRGP